MKKVKEIKLGNTVKDRITGFKGIATARIEYLNGCIQFCVRPKVEKGNKIIEEQYIDIDELEFINEGIALQKTNSGGYQRDCPKH